MLVKFAIFWNNNYKFQTNVFIDSNIFPIPSKINTQNAGEFAK